jgi:hypothetical protein
MIDSITIAHYRDRQTNHRIGLAAKDKRPLTNPEHYLFISSNF